MKKLRELFNYASQVQECKTPEAHKISEAHEEAMIEAAIEESANEEFEPEYLECVPKLLKQACIAFKATDQQRDQVAEFMRLRDFPRSAMLLACDTELT
jgi:chorismate mutase